MHHFEPPPSPPKRNTAIRTWAFIAALMVGPSLLVWIVCATAKGLGCTPGPALCHGMALGGGLRDTLNLAWMIGTDTSALVLLGIAAAIAALCARMPLVAALSALMLPLMALGLPALAVDVSTYDGCAANEAGIGTCQLWGAAMGMSFHHAAQAPWLLYDVVPYSFAAAIMLGLIGWLFVRQKR